MTLGKTPVHPPPLAPSPTLPPSPAWGVELVWLWLVTQALKHSTRRTLGPKPQKHNQPCGISHRLPPSHAAPNVSLLPLRGRLRPPSLLPPLATLDLKALHWTGCGRVCRVPGRGRELHPVLAQWSQMCHISSSQHWNCSTLEPFPRAKRWSLAWKGRLCLDVLEVVHWSCSSF